jgi:glutathione S-transferase
MKLYYHPVSTTSRPILLFAADHDLNLDLKVVDLFTGEHLQPPYAAINPSRLVPVLEDDDFRLTECSAILKYLAEKVGSPTYPADLRKRARVNERMDWLNTGFYRDLGYGVIYPQVLPNYRRPDDKVQAGSIEWGCDKAKGWLKILDEDLIGPHNAYLCGSEMSLADYLGAAMLTLGEVIHLDYSAYRNISRWLETMKSRPNWAKVNEGFYAYFVAPFKDGTFVGLG